MQVIQLNGDQLKELLTNDTPAPIDRELYIERLRLGVKDLDTPRSFRPGDIVNSNSAIYGGPCSGLGIFRRYLSQLETKHLRRARYARPSGPYWAEPEDCIIGFLSDDGAILEYPVSSRRFTVIDAAPEEAE